MNMTWLVFTGVQFCRLISRRRDPVRIGVERNTGGRTQRNQRHWSHQANVESHVRRLYRHHSFSCLFFYSVTEKNEHNNRFIHHGFCRL